MKFKLNLRVFILFSFFGCFGSFLFANDVGWSESGVASWYGGKFQGRLTANGEIFDTFKYTAAHKKLPFNTILQVTNKATGLSVNVRVNDRGPFVAGRIIDLSFMAAKKIGMTGPGVADVKIIVVKKGDGGTYHHEKRLERLEVEKREKTPKSKNWIQVASFSDVKNARRLQDRLLKKGFHVEMKKGKTFFQVGVPFKTQNEKEARIKYLNKLGYQQLLIRKIDNISGGSN